jgi:subtilisin family serine protease
VKRLVLLLLCAAAFLAVAPAYARAGSNPFGVTIVRFAPGTSPAQMQAAVAAAGGQVVTDLSPLGAMAVASSAPDFRARLGADSRVATFFGESMFDGPALNDGKGGGSLVDAPRFGKSRGGFPDPWHDASSFLGMTNPQGVLQWDDARMDVPAAWATTLGDRSVRVAVLDTGVQDSHRELRRNVAAKNQTFVPCQALKKVYGENALQSAGLTDCGTEDKDGHGTWVASRIAGDLNGFASNGVAPNAQVSSYKILASGFGAMPDWILAGLVAACSDGVDLVNMSITGYLDPTDPTDAQTYLLFNDAVQYCRARGVTIFAAAGNEHVRVNRVTMAVGGLALSGVGRVSTGPDGIGTTTPGSASVTDLRGLLEAPAGVPGVVMVSATNNGNDAAPADDPFGFGMHVGAHDQLAYYSSYGPRVDLAAPGGARRFNLPGWDGGEGNLLYGGWGSLGALAENGLVCLDPLQSSLFNFACFKSEGAGFGWLQGTSMAAPNALGVAALVLSAKPTLRDNPNGLVSRLTSTARHGMTNWTGPDDPDNKSPTYDGRACATGYCHLDTSAPIPFTDAYGAGLVDAGAAVTN